MIATQRWPRILVLCPTLGRPKLVQSAICCFLSQTYPAERRRMLIFEDGGQIESSSGDGWTAVACTARYPSMPEKYDAMLDWAERNWKPDVVALMDDDDCYLPSYLADQAFNVMSRGVGWAKNSHALSDYELPLNSLDLNYESALGRFHGSVACSWELVRKIGGWPKIKGGEFDQAFLAALAKGGGAGGDYQAFPQYIFRWGSTQALHAQVAIAQRGLDWYARMAEEPRPRFGKLSPKYDATTRAYYQRYAGRTPVGQLA